MRDTITSCINNTKGWQIIAYALLGVAIAIFLLTMPLLHLLAFLGAIALLISSIYKPELSIIAIVVLISSIIFEEKLPLIPIGIGSFHISDILLLFMFSRVVLKHLSVTKTMVDKSPLEKALALFLLSAVISALVSLISFGLDFTRVIRAFRPVSYYLLFYIVANLITTKKQIKSLVTGLLFVAAIVAVAMLIQATVGESIQLMPGWTQRASALEEELEAVRIQPPGQTLVFISFITAICFGVFQRSKSLLLSRYFYLVIILGMGVVLTYNRSYLIAILLSTGFFMFLATTGDRKRLMALLGGGATLIFMLVMVSLASGGKLENTFNAVSERYLSLVAGKDLVQSSSLTYRFLENRYAIEQIEKHPVLGIGLGNDYRPPIYGPEDQITHYVHNVYLWLMVDMGIPGFAFFIWFYVGFLVRAMKNYKKIEDNFLKSVATGSMLACMGMLPMALVIPLFMEWHSIVVIATYMGLSEAIIRNTKVQSQELSDSTNVRACLEGLWKRQKKPA